MSLMCLFLWLDYGIDIVDFENVDFLVGQPIFTSVRAGSAVVLFQAPPFGARFGAPPENVFKRVNMSF